jgi:hypothetical protein
MRIVSRTGRSSRVRGLGVILACLMLASSADALTCRDLRGIDPAYWGDEVLAEVDDILNSGAASAWEVNFNRIQRCVARRVTWIVTDLQDLCDQGMRSSMSAADDVIMNYIRSCVQ